MEAIFWDFDGVIIDSLEEWYRIGVLAYYGIDKAHPDYQHQELYKENCHLIYSDADEYCLFKALDNQDVSSFPKIRAEVDKKAVDIYSQKFQEIRKFYQDNYLNWWCDLHRLTEQGKTLTKKDSTKNSFILTRKNMKDVLVLKNYFKLEIIDSRIFDYSHSVKYGSKVNFIEYFLANYPEYQQAILIDDRLENLCKSETIKCYFAPWGYGKGNNQFETYQRF